MHCEIARDESEMYAIAKKLAPVLRSGDVIALYGGLGAGKTTFTRGLISALRGEKTEVPSPTYTLVQTYETGIGTVWHFDLYRLDQPDDVFELGWEDTQLGVTIIEWPERAGQHLPVYRLEVNIDHSTDNRQLSLVGHGKDWQERLDAL